MVDIAQTQLSSEHHVVFERALAACSRALLLERSDGGLEHALEALLHATDSITVFVERNVADPELGLCSSTVAAVRRGTDGFVPDVTEYWSMVPWDKLPDSYARLSKGAIFAFDIDDLGPVEREQYEGSPLTIRSELDIPIFVRGEWEGLIGFGHDLPRAWTADEIRLLRMAAEMIGAFWDSQRSTERLEAINRSKDELVASVSHELRTPLTTILGFADELSQRYDSIPPEEAREFVDVIASQAQDMAYIVEDLLVASRLRVFDLSVTQEEVPCRTLVDDVIAGLRLDIDLTTAAASGELMARADTHRVRQIVRNLAVNAQRYGRPPFRVEMTESRGEVCIAVIDSGDGIPADLEAKVFDPFTRADQDEAMPGSFGLGLAVSRYLAERMGGRLVYRNGDGEVRFELTLPAATRA